MPLFSRIVQFFSPSKPAYQRVEPIEVIQSEPLPERVIEELDLPPIESFDSVLWCLEPRELGEHKPSGLATQWSVDCKPSGLATQRHVVVAVDVPVFCGKVAILACPLHIPLRLLLYELIRSYHSTQLIGTKIPFDPGGDEPMPDLCSLD